MRSQSEWFGSLCIHSASRATICSRKCLMSLSSAVWNSLMKASRSCASTRADEPLADIEAPHEFHHLRREIDELQALIGLNDDGFTVNGQAAGCDLGNVFNSPFAHGKCRAFAHCVKVSSRPENPCKW